MFVSFGSQDPFLILVISPKQSMSAKKNTFENKYVDTGLYQKTFEKLT